MWARLGLIYTRFALSLLLALALATLSPASARASAGPDCPPVASSNAPVATIGGTVVEAAGIAAWGLLKGFVGGVVAVAFAATVTVAFGAAAPWILGALGVAGIAALAYVLWNDFPGWGWRERLDFFSELAGGFLGSAFALSKYGLRNLPFFNRAFSANGRMDGGLADREAAAIAADEAAQARLLRETTEAALRIAREDGIPVIEGGSLANTGSRTLPGQVELSPVGYAKFTMPDGTEVMSLSPYDGDAATALEALRFIRANTAGGDLLVQPIGVHVVNGETRILFPNLGRTLGYNHRTSLKDLTPAQVAQLRSSLSPSMLAVVERMGLNISRTFEVDYLFDVDGRLVMGLPVRAGSFFLDVTAGRIFRLNN